MKVHQYVDKKPKPYRQIMIRFPSGVTCQELSAEDGECRGDEKELPGSYAYWWRGTTGKKRRIVVTWGGGQSYLITNDQEKLRVANPEWFYPPWAGQ